jgi:cell wall-associated NlpC family hydrolase
MKKISARFLLAILLCTHLVCMGCAIFRAPSKRSIEKKEMSVRKNVTGWAENYIGTNYKYAGTNPDQGFDCSGFTSFVMKEFDIKISHGSSQQAKQGRQIDMDDLQPGDLVFFGSKKGIQHVALVSEVTKEGIICVHATNTRGVVKENISTSDYWKKRILFARDVIHGED